MSWFTDFLTDTARQAAPGIHQGINDDQKKRRDLEAMRQTIPILVEQQQALQPGRMEELRAKDESDTRRALMIEAIRNQTRGQRPQVVGGRLVNNQGGVVYEPPPAKPTQAEDLMSRVLGPLGSSTQESPVASGPGAGTPQKPAALPPGMSVTSGGVTLRSPGAESGSSLHIIPPQPGQPPYSWRQGETAQPIPGVPSRPEIAEKLPPKPPAQANSPEAVMGEIFPGMDWGGLSSEQRAKVNKTANERALSLVKERGKGFAYSRSVDLLDTATGKPTKMSLGEYLDREDKQPGRYMPLSSQAAPFYPSDIAEQQTRYLASVGELKALQSQRGKIMAFVNTTESNLGLVEELSERVDRTGVPAVNRWLMAGKRTLAGDPEVAKLDAAMRTAINEYARVTSTATGGGVTSDAARREVESMLNTSQTKEQVREVIQLLRREMNNRKTGYDQQIAAITKGIRGDTGTGRAQTPPPQSGGIDNDPLGIRR